MPKKVKLSFQVNRSAETELARRAEQMTPRGPPSHLDPLSRSIHFLRGVHSRSGFALSAFYMFLASDIEGKRVCTVPSYPGTVFQSFLHYSAFNTMSLACRKAFDHGTKGALTGAAFGKQSDSTLISHGEYWAKLSGRPYDDAIQALVLLRSFFAKCSKTDTNLFKDGSTLGQRIGLLKQHADRSAAHLSMENYSVGVLDLAHVVAALSLVGEIVRSFDAPGFPPDHYNKIDEAAFDAANALFPDALKLRLFGRMKVEQQASACWRFGHDNGIHMLTEQLPYAISWF
jgi:hypothetical protein